MEIEKVTEGMSGALVRSNKGGSSIKCISDRGRQLH